ncbi:vacuolar protein sorting-associated protein 13A/C, partial [Lecanoromycetidae sp. Uapishka_2]
MLEGLVAGLLNRFLGMYVKNFDPKQLNVGIWNGDVKLRNLELRKEALDQLHLPVNVVEGHLGQLTMSIPWTNLRGKPVRISIEDVFLLAAPKEDAEYNEEEEAKRANDVKLEKLENAELLKSRNTDGMSNEEQQKSQSFTESVTTAIVDNLQISIKNIHIRYEDSIASPGHPYAVGLTLQEFSAVRTDKDWRPSYIQSASDTTNKLAVLNALAFYWNTDANLFGSGKGEEVGAEAQGASHGDMVEKFRKASETGEHHQYMLKPVSGRAAVELDKTGKVDRPKIKARLLFNELGFVLDDEQYRDALMMVDLFHYFIRHQEYKKFQPKSTTKEDPKAWLRFAFQAVYQKIKDRNRQNTWGYIKERRDDRIRYIDLFKKKKKEEKMNPAEIEEFNALEKKLGYEDLRFWRSLARNQLRKENAGVKKPAAKQSWTQWAWGKKPEEEHTEDDSTLSEEQRKELYAAIDWDEKKAIAESVDLPRESVKLQLESSLRSGSFTLKRDPHGKANEILSLMFDNFQAKALQRPDSFLADISLGGMRINDGTTEGSLFPQIVNFKDPTAGSVKASIEDVAAEDANPDSHLEKAKATEEALFHMIFEQNPLDESADSALTMKLKSIEVIYNPYFVVGVANFFKPPERHMESIGALLETAGATVEGIRQQTRAGLEFALEEHKTLNANLDIQAPLIIVPESITEESALCLIIDAGHVSLNSDLVDKKTMQEIQSKQKKQYSDEDFRQLEGLMYDKFLLKLDSTQLLIGPGIQATKDQLNAKDDPKNLHIIDRINMDFTLETSIIPKASDLTKTRISGHLPVLHASISDKKYKDLMKLIDIAIPKFDTDESFDGRTKAPTKDTQLPLTERSKAQDVMGRERSKSVSAGQQDLEVEDSDDESVEKSTDSAKKEGESEEVNLHQRNFEFKFTVDKLQGSLYRSDPEGRKPDQLLVEMVAEHFFLDFYLRPYDTVAEVLLKSLNVEDYIDEDPSPEFKKIISSKGFDAKEDKDLFNVKFIKVNNDSPEFDSTYEGIATHLDVSISTLNLIVTRKTLLTLLDFVLVTFANSDDSPPPAKSIEQNDSKKPQGESVNPPPGSDKIRIKVDLESVALILNNDGIRLATLTLNRADVGLFLSGGSMNVAARLGKLSLVDDINQGASADSPLRQLVAIQGDQLADFKYDTFDAKSKNYPGYDSKIYLRSGSIRINFLEEPFRKIINFLVKFGKMQAIFNAARQAAANQASQMQESTSKMHFDVLIKTPILVFPRVMTADKPRDLLTAYLGEIYASNEFVYFGSMEGNKISAGIRNVRLTSEFHYDDDVHEELEMIDKVDLDFKVTSAEHQSDSKRPDLEVEGKMSPINLRVAQTELKFLMELSQTVPNAFATDPDDQAEQEVMEELPQSTVEPAKNIAEKTVGEEEQPKSPTNQGPELESSPDSWTKLEFVFDAPTIALELILATEDEPVGDTEAASLSEFALNDTKVKLRMKTDDSLEAELLINSFTIKDSRKNETNKFRRIMSLINDDVKQQFMASVTMSGGKDRHMIAMLTVDSPRVIMAIDYLLAVQAFANSALPSGEPIEIEDTTQETILGNETDSGVSTPVDGDRPAIEGRLDPEPAGQGAMSMSFRVNIVDAQIILIANPTISNSEAIVLGTKQVLVSQQNASTLQITKVGMFLCRMDKFDTSRLRILDDFSITMSMDSRSQGKKSSLTSISVDIEPLVLRLSLRDILLALQIVNKASEMSNNISGGGDKEEDTEPGKIKQITGKTQAASTKRKSIAGKPTSTVAKRDSKSVAPKKESEKPAKPAPSSIVMTREEMTATIEGIRVILIGDLHELPLLDWSVKKFNVDVRDWSSAMTGDTSFDTYINVYNFSKSAWEPLLEPWQIGFHVNKETNPDSLSVEMYSHKMMEVTVTSATIALASKSAQFLSTEEDVLSKPRGSDAPYKIRNYTGFDLSVWAAAREEDQGSAAKLTDGEESGWRFEDPTTMREKLSPEGNAGIVGIKLEGSGFDSVERIGVNREGETLYNLKPRKENVLHRLLVEVKLGSDNVKYITFRSPLVVENNTQIPVEIGVFSPEEGHLLKIEKIAPGDARPAPIGAAFMHSLVVRPDQGFGYSWSNERLFWKDLLKRSTRTITCKGEKDDQSPPFYFQMNASYEKNDPMTKVYPYMRIKLHAPIEVQNLLPYDFKYRIYDKNTKKDWTNFLRKGGLSPVHVVELSHLLLLSVDLQDTVFKQSEFAVVNSSAQENFRRENTLAVKDPQGIQLNLKLHYFNIPESGGAFKVSVYSPYLVLNKTGLDINIQSKTMFSSAKSAAGQGMRMDSDRGTRKALPYMFSYPSEDRKNRANLKVGDSAWSKPQSFDAIGSAFETVLPSTNAKSELTVGVSVAEGEGKYNLTKVVTVAPRFVLKNKLKEQINIREPGSNNVMSLKTGELLPLHFLKQAPQKQLCLCFDGVNNQWSSPFNIANVGTVHVKLAKSGQRQQLIRVEVIMEAATIFLHISIETKHWPFSMRNESDLEFMFHQSNPNIEEDEEDRGTGWKPIRYRLPAKSIMPYAWDYPAAKNKELIMTCNGKERRVKLAEIGNLVPMKVPGAQNKPSRIIDLNIAADGPTQTLVLSNYKQSKSLYKQKSGSAQASQATGFEVKEMESDVTFKAQLRLAGVGLSLVNTQLKELLYFTLREIELKYSDSKLYQTLNSTIKWIQIDNQLYGGIFPILLYPSVVPKTGKEMEAHPIFHAMVTRVKDDSYGVMYIKYFTLLLQQMTLELDEDFIFTMLDFTKVPGASWSEEAEGKLCDENLDIPEPKQEEQGQDIYFEFLHLQPMQLDLSFVRTERINAEDTVASSNPLMFFVNIMTMSVGNVNDAPLRFNALMLENARISIPALAANVQGHYTQECIRQMHIILGSADFLGNPVGLFNNVSSGVADIFYEPYQGLVMTDRPQELGIGIAKGASSFVKKSVFGFSDSMAKFTGSMSKGLAAATLDKEYQDQRRMSKSRNRPKHALYGVTSGGNAFATSIASGIGGLARHPMQGAEKEGVQGFVKGVGKGFLGLATKPAIGAFDLASNMAEGVRNTTTVFDQEGLDRVRLTRFIGMDGIVRPYAQREALGQFWLKTLDDGKYFHEDYIAHLELQGKDLLVMLTYNRIMLVKTKKLKSEWDIKLNDIQTISKERTGMNVTLKGGTNGPFIPVSEESSRNWLYKQIGIAVNAFNDKYNAKG